MSEVLPPEKFADIAARFAMNEPWRYSELDAVFASHRALQAQLEQSYRNLASAGVEAWEQGYPEVEIVVGDGDQTTRNIIAAVKARAEAQLAEVTRERDAERRRRFQVRQVYKQKAEAAESREEQLRADYKGCREELQRFMELQMESSEREAQLLPIVKAALAYEWAVHRHEDTTAAHDALIEACRSTSGEPQAQPETERRADQWEKQAKYLEQQYTASARELAHANEIGAAYAAGRDAEAVKVDALQRALKQIENLDRTASSYDQLEQAIVIAREALADQATSDIARDPCREHYKSYCNLCDLRKMAREAVERFGRTNATS